MTQVDPRIQRTKKAFKKAFEELFSEHDDYMDITVTKLCERAGLNRKTFYLHYKQIDDLLDEMLEDMCLEFFTVIRNKNAIYDERTIVETFFELSDNNAVHKKMNASFIYHYLKPTIVKKYVEVLEKDGIMRKLTNEYNALEYIGFTFYYMILSVAYFLSCTSNRDVTREEIINYSVAILRQISEVFKKPKNIETH